jgi:hypothetical protein
VTYDFHLICDQDPGLGLFADASAQFGNKFTLTGVDSSEALIVGFNGENLALLTAPLRIPNSEVRRIFGEDIADQIKGEAWVSEVSCPHEKDTAEAVRSFLTLTVIGTNGLLVDPQSNEVINADWGS